MAPKNTPAPTRPVLRYHGGKWLLASWVISHFPRHRIFVEPFCGAASVLMQKPRSYSEVLNDQWQDLVSVFRCLQEPAKAEQLQSKLELTPYARVEYDLACSPGEIPDDVEKARRMIIRSFMGFGSGSTFREHKTGFRSNSNRSGTTPARDWVNYPTQIAAFTARLRGVVLECRDALSLIPQHDTPGTLFYCDPPYPRSTRSVKSDSSRNGVYAHEMSDDKHRELAKVLRQVKGMVVLSGYPCDLYDCELYPDWVRVERPWFADGARKRMEVLWINPAAANVAQGKLPLFAPDATPATEGRV